ncbi:glutathione synthase [Celerinatantimonas yamalensis]|uniref:Glutathione synthetase n=1 Tax=Celerinatantimonas yamalensis TaxID=559956 RepID=A0ABW9GB17_9GAMM
MTIKLGIVMDPIESISFKKDTSLAMLLAAQRRGYELYYMQMNDLFMQDGQAYGQMSPLTVADNPDDYYQLGESKAQLLRELDVILMRKDPPFDTEFIYATYMLERAEDYGTLIVNKPQSLRDANEKLFTAWFSEFTPPTLVTRDAARLKAFYQQHQDVIMKPLDGMGGTSIFRLKPDDANVSVVIETLTAQQSQYCMAQTYLPEIKDGDKRILIVDGEPMPYCLARIPPQGETRGNLAAGGRGEARPLSESDWRIARAIGPTLKAKGLIFVGLDVIGEHITEINVTSPTCIREIQAAFGLDIAEHLMQAIERRLSDSTR